MDKLTFVKSQWDRLTAVGTAIAGGVVLIVGWFGVSSTAYPAEQLPYVVSAGLGALFLLGVASVLWLSADLNDEWRKLDRLEQAVRATSRTDVAEDFNDTEYLPAYPSAHEPYTARTAQLPRVVDGSDS